MLEIKNFSIKIKDNNQEKTILDRVSFSVDDNEIHCVLGRNGSGKTTLAYGIMGLEKSKIIQGKIILNGQDLSNKKVYQRARAGIALAFQEPARFEGLLVKDFLEVSLKKSRKRSVNLEVAINLVGLDEEILARKIDHSLSGGERKRIELASVILMNPKIMILDEPDTSLDIVVYNELYDLLLRIKEEIKCSIILITHREEAGLIANRATLMEKGKIVKTGNFREVMRAYCLITGKKDRCRTGQLYKTQALNKSS
ncbi:MAG: ATP-binding cassette domain-containing protein [Candidatus Moranbacteria bacterium]|jgi:Fe-S cluster assembly ATP-binding protein|nr:ATP-binding cassette domain-containing protein [Candidatus Moranbacteria bacterium]